MSPLSLWQLPLKQYQNLYKLVIEQVAAERKDCTAAELLKQLLNRRRTLWGNFT